MPTGTSSSTHGMSKEIYDKINDNQLKKYNIQDMIRFTRNLWFILSVDMIWASNYSRIDMSLHAIKVALANLLIK